MKKLKFLLSIISIILFFTAAVYLPYILFTKNLREIATLLQPILNINPEKIPPITVIIDRDMNSILVAGIIYTITALATSIVCYFKETYENILEVIKSILLTLFKALWLIGPNGIGIYVIKVPSIEILKTGIQITLDISIIAAILLLLSILEVITSVIQAKQTK